MEMDTQEREADLGDDSPISHNEEDMSEGDGPSGPEQDDSNDDIRRRAMLADHSDVLAKLKMQVRDINVRDDFENQRNQLNFSIGNNRPQDTIPFPVPFPFPHPATAFLPPMAPPPQPPSSGSSHSSEGSASSQHTWSFEEQFKQVRQLYEITDDPKRKEFLDDLFSFMQKRGTPINRLPIMAKSVLDLYELYNLVIARGGLVDVINKKLWQEIIKGLHLPSSITSAAFTLRTQYMKYLYNYECEKNNLSTPAELQAAIDGNRREGRRSSYGQYDTMSRYAYENAAAPHQLNPLQLVSAAQQQQLAARMSSVMAGGMSLHNGAHAPAHHQTMNPPTNGNPLAGDFEVRMLEYMKLINREARVPPTTSPRQMDLSPPNAPSAMTPFELQSRLNMFYNNAQNGIEPQREPINLSENASAVKREPEVREISPPAKRVSRVEQERPRTPESPVRSSSTHIRINSRGDSGSSDNSLVVSMELNGVTYQGVLFAQTAQASSLAI